MISGSVAVRARARRDIEEARDFYRLQAGDEIAARFLDAVEAAFGLIAAHPASGSTRHAHEAGVPGLRSQRLVHYPYLVFYVERSGKAEIWRVLHAQRDIPHHMAEQN